MTKECTLSTGKLPVGGLLRNSAVMITDHPDMTIAVYHGRKAPNQRKDLSCNFRVCTKK